MSNKAHLRYYIHTAIGLTLMFGIGLLPPFGPITQVGMQVGGIFLGLIYLWSMVNILWPSLLGLAALALSDCTNISGVLAASFGNNIVILMIFILALVGVVELAGIPEYIIQFIMTRKVIEGRPWVFTIIIFLGTYACSVFTGIVGAFLFWAIMYQLFDKIGYKKGDSYTKLLIFGIGYCTCLGTFLMPFHGMALLITGTMQSILPDVMLNYASYLIVIFIVSMISIFLYILAMKYIFRADVSLLKKVTISMFEENKLPLMSKLQKFLLGYLLLMVVLLLLPSFLPKAWLITQKMNSLGSAGTVLLLFSLLCIIQKDGKSLVNFSELAQKKITWELVFLSGTAIAISAFLTKPETGITEFLGQILNPIFLNKTPFVFVALLCLLAIVLTNIANNGVIAVLLMTISCLYAPAYNINPAIVVVLLAYTTNIAFLLPASSMFGAICHGNPWLEAKDIYKYTIFVAVLALILIVVVGYPLATLLP